MRTPARALAETVANANEKLHNRAGLLMCRWRSEGWTRPERA